MAAEALLNCERWLTDPEFFGNRARLASNPLSFARISREDPQVKRDFCGVHVRVRLPFCWVLLAIIFMASVEEISSLVSHYRDILGRLTRRRKAGQSTEFIPSNDLQFIAVEEMKIAEIEILKNVQRHHFLKNSSHLWSQKTAALLYKLKRAAVFGAWISSWLMAK